jgi:hypothetical protein
MAQQQKPTAPVKTVAHKTYTKTTADTQHFHFVFDKSNYRLLIASALVVALGFFIMSGTTDIYSNTKIVLAPLVVLGGFGLGFYAILKKPAPKA